MLKLQFLDYIRSQNLFSENDRILLTISGGMDSMVMLNLFVSAKFRIGIAHCNFNLRGDESNKDASFVRLFARDNAIPYFEKSFDTTKFAKHQKYSIQEAARELRYQWFKEIALQEKYKYYATAHHFDDQIETFFINLFRGTGVKGLRGILPKSGSCTRPLLFATRDEISDYATKHKILYREDSSNQSDKYLRNRIRHHILPALKSTKGDFKTGFEKTFTLLSGTEKFIDAEISNLKKKLFLYDKDQVRIPIDELKKMEFIEFYLYELLKSFDFNEDVISKIPIALNKIPGKLFLSKTHQLLVDRQYLIISPITKTKRETYLIEAGKTEIFNPVKLAFENFAKTEDTSLNPARNIAQFDFDKIEFPLKLRRWEEGDYFYPFGMKGRKKVSDYFIDLKFSLFEKQKTWMLLSGDSIIWIVGHRIDNRVKISKQTKSIFKITLI
jgi:tRNA(Ile)-lysidine synthase